MGTQGQTVPMPAVDALGSVDDGVDRPDEDAEQHHEDPASGQAATLVMARTRVAEPLVDDALLDDALLDAIEESTEPAQAEEVGPRRRVRIDLYAYGAFLILAFWLTHQYWMSGHVSRIDISDQAFFEFMLAHGAQVVTHLSNPFYTTTLNVPVGVNLMMNTSVLALSIPLAPVTLLFGPAISFALLMTLGLAGTAAAWYFVLSRHVVESRWAAVIGGLIAGFGPGMISHALGHPNIIAQFLVPFIAWRTVKLREQGRSLRNGVALAVLIIVQAFINEEILFILALGMAFFVLAYALSQRRTIRPLVKPFGVGLGITFAIVAAALAYPLWWQFFGPNTYNGLSPGVKAFSTDLAAFPAFGTQTIFGSFTDHGNLAKSLAEQNTFLGWPLLIACGVAIYWLRRNVVARSIAAAGFGLGVLSLGSNIKFDGHLTGIPGPWRLVNNLPVFDSAVPTRFSLLVLPVVAVLVALAHDRALAEAPRNWKLRAESVRPRFRQARLAWCLLLVVALVAVIPTPVPTQQLPPTPAFIASGQWRQFVSGNQTILPIPLPGPAVVDSMFWSAQSKLAIQLPRGYFLGPDPTHDNVAFFGAPARPTAVLLAEVLTDDEPAVVHKSDRMAAVEDLRYWRVAVIVQDPNSPDDRAIRETISDLVGIKPKFLGGLWVWDVRQLVAGHSYADLE
jgi:6-pyruvoyl-tetrahydropterin synthase related domain